jgi:hypothetical protein
MISGIVEKILNTGTKDIKAVACFKVILVSLFGSGVIA